MVTAKMAGNRCGAFAMTSLLATSAALIVNAAFALPEGAPWGAANPDAAENCGTCHFGYAPETDSDALTVDGLPEQAVPGGSYELIVGFEDHEAVVAGFQLLATGGEFSAGPGDLEYLGAAIRSVKARHADAEFRWTLTWTAPETPGTEIVIYLGVVGGNDDLSPFGDRAYFRSFETSL